MPDPIEGRLAIQLRPGERANAVDIRSSRPVAASQLFVSKPPDSAVKTIPLLFNICGNAQLVTANRAIESSLGTAASDACEEWRDALLHLEILREQLWRILLEWPRMSDYTPDTTSLASFNQELNRLIELLRRDPDISGLGAGEPSVRIDSRQWQRLSAAIEQALFAGPAVKWLELSGICSLEEWCDRQRSLPGDLIRDIFDKRWHSLGFSDYQPLSKELDADVYEKLRSEEAGQFIRQPTLEEFCLETGPLARNDEHPLIEELLGLYGNGLLARVVARLVDIAVSLVRLGEFFNGSARLPFQRGHDGIATVEAARGRLTHKVSIEADRILDYRILAPTEWNFHPNGVVARGLASLRATNPEILRQQAAMLIHAVDPCVGYDLSVGEADA